MVRPPAGLRRDRGVVVLAAGLLVALCWGVLVRDHAAAGTGHGLLEPRPHHHGGAGFAAAFGMWMVMMVGMMLPAVLPWILVHTETSRARRPGASPHLRTALFVAGYFVVWALYSAAAAGAQGALARARMLEGSELRTGAIVSGVLLLAAGVFQLTALKAACLTHCRNPLTFFLARWRAGPANAFGLGLRHGAWCVACCWALMALCFALGVMNLVWMAALTVLLCIEKIAPGGPLWSRGIGAALCLWGLWVLIAG